MLGKLAVAILPCLIMIVGAGLLRGWSAAMYTLLGSAAGLLGLWLWQIRSSKNVSPRS
jgi:hypothetical protein